MVISGDIPVATALTPAVPMATPPAAAARTTDYSGGSYGGYGGSYSGGAVNAVYGDPLNPNEVGSGGAGDSNYAGGNGGGLVRIKASTVQLDGSLIADGVSGGYYGGGGSGGGIRIDTGTLSGAGYIYARGGTTPSGRGGGGGGRIAVYYGTMSLPQGNLIASGASTSYSGGAGTIYLKSTIDATDRLIVDNRGIDTGEGSTLLRSLGSGVVNDVTADTLTAGGVNWQPGALKGMKFAPDVTQSRYFTVIDNDATSLRIDPAEGDLTQATARGLIYSGVYAFTKVSVLGKGRLTCFDRFVVDDELLVDGSTLVTNNITADKITVRNGGLISQWRTTTSQEFKLELAVGTLSIDTASKVDVSGRGYLGAYQGGNNTGTGRTNGNTITGGSSSYSGGSYGGYGGYYSGAVAAVYGDQTNPNEFGSGGGGDSGSPGGNGGGLVRINAGTISLDGSIVAPSGYYGGGGSGGGIRIDAGILSGAGLIYARGGGSPNNRGGGGGGRIALYCGSITLPSSNVAASGGSGSASGKAGTVFFY